MGRTNSADPDRLDAYHCAAAELADGILRRTGALDDALGRLVASGSAGAVPTAGLPHAVRANAVAHRRLATWVAEVAAAFRRADEGALPPPPGRGDPAAAELVGLLEGVRWALASGIDDLVATAVATLLASPLQRGPDAVATLAAELDPGQLRALARTAPALVGPVDGWPVAVRYLANRRLVEAALATATGARRRSLLRLLAADPVTGRHRQLLLFDPRGDGRAAEVFGTLAAATSVAVYVPGMGSDLADFGPRIAAKARLLWQATGGGCGPPTTAVVAWLGYDAPDDLPSLQATGTARARTGGAQLVAAVAGLGLAAGQRLTIVAHSYGTVVAAHALLAGLPADRLLVMGSPGMPGHLDAPVAGRRRRTELFTMEAPGDLVTDLERFGPDPNEVDSGFTRLETGGHGHSSYLAAGSPSLANAVAVVTGDDEALVHRSPTLLERAEAARDRIPDAPAALDRAVDAVQRHGQVPLVGGAVDDGVDLAQGLVRWVQPDAVLERTDDSLDRLADVGRALLG